MIIYEYYGVTTGGTSITRAYSNAGRYIERDGRLYRQALDPTDDHITYTETETLIPTEDEE